MEDLFYNIRRLKVNAEEVMRFIHSQINGFRDGFLLTFSLEEGEEVYHIIKNGSYRKRFL